MNMTGMVSVVSKASMYMYMCIYNILYKYVICNLHYIYNYLKIGIYQHTICIYTNIYMYVYI